MHILTRGVNVCDAIFRSMVVRMIHAYQFYISSDKNHIKHHYISCRFFPSCSDYAKEAFTNKSFFSALLLTVRRIMRCAPWCEGGYDPL